MSRREVIIYETHRGLYYEDGKFLRVLEPGRYVLPRAINLGFYRRPKAVIAQVDVRERDLTLKNQEILTADKVALRVSILVQFRVNDPRAALHEVANYEDRLYGDVQLAARRSLASMTLEDILTNRNKLSEDIRADVRESAAGYGVTIARADVKDLIFPGNLQEIMNRVLVAERTAEASLVDSRTRAESARIDAEAQANIKQIDAQAEASARRLAAESESEAQRVKTEAQIASLRALEQVAGVYGAHPALLRLRELESLSDLARVANARIYIGFDKHFANREEKDG